MPRTKKRNQSREKRTQSRFYEGVDGQKLFVPTEEMLSRHEASMPVQVLKRADLKLGLWKAWKKEYPDQQWFFEWLYGANAPEKPKLIHPSTRAQGWKREALDDEFFVTDEMIRFRRYSRPTGAWARANGLSPDLIKHWQISFGRLDWFDSWLMCGADSPADVRIASAGEIQRARLAWDYQAILREHGIDQGSHSKWLNEDFPQVQTRRQFFSWVWWLFGGPTPPGWFIVPQKALKLKQRLTIPGIRKAAGVRKTTYDGWQDDPDNREALADVLRSSTPVSMLYGWHRRHKNLHEVTKRKMLAVATASRLNSALKDVGWSVPDWYECRDDAKEVGDNQLREALEAYVYGTGDAANERRADATGVVALGLFVPSPTMVKFRKAIIKRKTKRRIAALCASLPADCFEQWFFDWALPRRSSKSDRLWYRKLLDGEQKSAGTKPTSSTSGVTPDDLVTIKDVMKKTHKSRPVVSKCAKEWGDPYLDSRGGRDQKRWSLKVIRSILISQFSLEGFEDWNPSEE